MTKQTDNYHLIQPEQKDFYNVDEFNENAEIIDRELKAVTDSVPTNLLNGSAAGSVRTIGSATLPSTPIGSDAFAQGSGAVASGAASHARGIAPRQKGKLPMLKEAVAWRRANAPMPRGMILWQEGVLPMLKGIIQKQMPNTLMPREALQ